MFKGAITTLLENTFKLNEVGSRDISSKWSLSLGQDQKIYAKFFSKLTWQFFSHWGIPFSYTLNSFSSKENARKKPQNFITRIKTRCRIAKKNVFEIT